MKSARRSTLLDPRLCAVAAPARRRAGARSLSRLSPTRSLAAVAALVAALTATSGSLSAFATSSPTPGTAAQVAALVAGSVSIVSADATVLSELPAAKLDIADIVYSIPATCNTATTCVYGKTTSTKTIVLYGNSHARMWLPSIIPAAITNNLKIVLLGLNGCPVVDINLTGSNYAGCNQNRTQVFAVINALHPKAVLLADRTVGSLFTVKQWQAGMSATIHAIKPSGAHVVIIGDIQQFNASPPECLAAYPTNVQAKCSIPNPNPKLKGLEPAELAAAIAAKDLYVNPVHWLCTATKCSPVIGDFIAYWGADHVSVTYARYLSKVMGLTLHKTMTS